MLHIITEHLMQHKEEMLGRVKQHVPRVSIHTPGAIIKLSFILKSTAPEMGGKLNIVQAMKDTKYEYF